MSAQATDLGATQAFLAAQKQPPEQRDASFAAMFYRELQHVTARIHETDNIDQLMLDASADICRVLNADRLTLYAITDDQAAIVSKIKTGLNTTSELKLPVSAQSIAGFVALHRQPLKIANVSDQAELQAIDRNLTFLQEVDRRSGYRTKQMLVFPVLEGRVLHGVLQVMNTKNDLPFGTLELEGMAELCKTLATAMRQRAERAAELKRRKPTKYGGLVTDGVLLAEELERCVTSARERAVPVESLLLTQYQVRVGQLGQSLARFFSVPYEPFGAGRQPTVALHGALKREFVERQGWIPLEETPDGLVVMCIDPEATRASRMLPQVYPRIGRFLYRVTTQTEFDETLKQLLAPVVQESSIDKMLADMDVPLLDEEGAADDFLASAASDNELVKFVNKVIVDAVRQKASDIHIEPMPGKGKTGIRFRIDGTLIPYIEVPAQFRQAMVTRLKIMCDLDISERRKPQDGKIKFRKYGPLDIELRVATIPSTGGVEDVVMRILTSGEPIPLDQLGLTAHNRERLLHTVGKPYGLFYVCGPTGSGKTTTLHSVLSHLNRPDTKIWTVEDPVEITQKGLRQVQVNRKAGIDFAMCMRAFLRADPDIIMVGESRDRETVSMGVEASLTGHLVFSTLHTNSAPESVTRLLDMGMDPFNFADALLGVLAQRLAKKLCTCREAYFPDAAEIHRFVAEYAEELRATPAWVHDAEGEARQLQQQWITRHGDNGRLRLYRAVGCDTCNQTGYSGRVGLHELLVTDDAIKKLVQERARVSLLFTTAVENGMRTLKMDGMEKALQGLTDLKQVRAVCIK
ncbi:MAG TPA: ATPase, T2SS/T4P/T4SS family [Burkholderiaceae bacterium]